MVRARGQAVCTLRGQHLILFRSLPGVSSDSSAQASEGFDVVIKSLSSRNSHSAGDRTLRGAEHDSREHVCVRVETGLKSEDERLMRGQKSRADEVRATVT
jgi:hypothetical protein